MSAEVLRRAASRMRHDARNATPGRWKLWGMAVMADQDGTSNVDTAVPVAQTHYRDENDKPRTWDASHIAGMQPGVALAMADWLDQHADQHETTGRDDCIWEDWACQAFMVARAYLGEPDA